MSGLERVIFGFHTVLARLRADPKSVIEVFLDESRKDARAKDFAAQVERAGARLMRVSSSRLEGMAGGGRHQGARVGRQPPFRANAHGTAHPPVPRRGR